jgi:hypothetical protein
MKAGRPFLMKFKTLLVLLLVLAILGVAGYTGVEYYSYIFAQDIEGEVLKIERVTQPSAIIANGTPIPASHIFSFAIAIRDQQGTIHTASGEDKQWAVVEKGQCVEAKFFPYPPWNLDRSGTFYGARLLKLYDCKSAGK